jgi:hypothetical protein
METLIIILAVVAEVIGLIQEQLLAEVSAEAVEEEIPITPLEA